MSNIIEIGFGNDKSRSKKNQTTKTIIMKMLNTIEQMKECVILSVA